MTGKQFRILMALTVVSGFLGGAASNLLLDGAPAMAQAGPPAADVVKARKFEVVDNAGKTQAVLGSIPNSGPGLCLFDATGKQRAALSLLADGSPGIALWDSAGKQRALLSVEADGGPVLRLYDAGGKPRVVTAVSKEGAYLNLLDEKGTVGTSMELLDQGRGFRVFDAKAKGRASLQLVNDLAALALWNADGTLLASLPAAAEAAPSRPVVQPAPGGNYGSAAGALLIREVTNEGRYVVLSDGSYWEISFLDQRETANWHPWHRIVLVQDPGDMGVQLGMETCKLMNADRGNNVAGARYMGRR